MDDGSGMAIDGAGNLIITGMFSCEVDFDPTNAVEIRAANGPYEIFTGKFDTNGNFIWVRTWGSTETVRWVDPDPL